MYKSSLMLSKQSILDTVSILDIAESFGIELEEVCSSNFSHRCRCPSKNHKSGSETASLYINSKDNNFYYCGCQAHIIA